MESKRHILISIVPAIFALLILGYTLLVSSGSLSLGPVNKNILYITQPVSSLTGTVKAVNGKRITLEKTLTITPTPAKNSRTDTLQKPLVGRAVFIVEVTDTTRFEQQSSPLDYEAKTGRPMSTLSPSVTGIHTGDLITIHTKADLRTLTTDSIIADLIILPPAERAVSGTLIEKKADTIVIHGAPVSPVTIEATEISSSVKDYRFTVSPLTKVVKHTIGADPSRTEATPIDFGTIPLNVYATVYTDKPVNDSSPVTALYVGYTDSTLPDVPLLGQPATTSHSASLKIEPSNTPSTPSAQRMP